MTDQGRRDRRYAARQALLVSCPSWGEFVQLYGADVSQGGMFIITEDPPPILSTVEVKLGLPEGHEILLAGRVVHVISVEQAKLEGRDPGVGLEFQDLDFERKMQIQQLVEFAQTQGQNPNASFSRHLLEVSPSQPPGKILESLPPPAPPSSVPASVMPSERTPARVSQPPRSSRPAVSMRSSSTPTAAPASSAPPARASTPEVSAEDTGEHVLPSDVPDDAARLSSGSRGSDPQKLKLGMTHLSYKRFAQAQRTFEALLAIEPNDREAKKWLLITRARQCLSKNNEDAAAEAYKELLEVDEANHEARKFVRTFHVNRRISSLPFGRYFVKKKPESKKKSTSRH